MRRVGVVLLVLCGCSARTEHAEDLPEPPARPLDYAWQQINPQLDAVHFVNEKLGWAVGAGNTVLATEDGGAHWTPRPNDREPSSHFHSVYFVNEKVGWMVGQGAEILKTKNGGYNWEEQSNPRPLPLYAIMFADEMSGCAVGAGGTILTTANGGARWEERNPRAELSFDRFPPGLFSVWWGRGGLGWVAGADGALLKTADGGKHWEPGLLGKENLRGVNLHGLDFTDEKTGWAVGSDGAILRTQDGRSWKRVSRERDNLPILRTVYFANRDQGMVVGDGVLLTTQKGGEDWDYWLNHEKPIGQTQPYEPVLAAHFVNEKKGWVVTQAGDILATEDGGEKWIYQRKGLAVGGQNLRSIRFAGKDSGWIVGGRWRWGGNVFLRTQDAGATWQPGQGERRERAEGGIGRVNGNEIIRSVHPVDSAMAWAVGDRGRVWRTGDGGRTWQMKNMPHTTDPLNSVYFSSRARGWAVGHGGVIVATENEGKDWVRQGQGQDSVKPSDLLEGVFFVGETHGWAVGSFGVILATKDGGRHWDRLPRVVNYRLRGVYFLDREQGWVVGDRGTILSTRDAGKTWQPRASGVEFDLMGVHFLDPRRGFVVGGYDRMSTQTPILATTDGGQTWVKGRHDVAATLGLSSVWAADDANVWAVGLAGAILHGTPVNRAAWVSWFSVSRAFAGVRVEWKVADEQPAGVKCTLEYAVEGVGSWSPVNTRVERRGETLYAVWRPDDHGIREQSKLLYRVSLTDQAGLSYTQALPGAYPYRSFWESRSGGEKATAITLAAVLAYLITAFAVLWVRPLTFLWLQPRFSAEKWGEKLPKSGSLASVGSLLLLAAELSLTAYFARHGRTRRDRARRYGRGEVKVKDLPATVREEYLESDDCVDAWVDRRIEAVRRAFGELQPVLDRPKWIPVPVQITHAGVVREMTAPPTIADFRNCAVGDRIIFAVVGDGGIGKSTLALQLARWGIADDPMQRLAPHRMLPVLVDDNTTDLVAAVAAGLREMAADADTDPDIIKAPLRSRRILVVIDGLSERSPETKTYVAGVFATLAVNAMVITSAGPRSWERRR